MVSQSQGFPQTAGIADAKGNLTQPWRQFFVSLWNRTGQNTGGTIIATGSPVAGNLTQFSAPAAITNGNLSGDVTTSGSLAATLKTVNASPGTYSFASVTVNAKGLVTAASSGAAGLSVTITTAKLTSGGTNGSMTFTGGILTAQTAAT